MKSPVRKSGRGIFLWEEKANNALVIIRALFLSVVIHLVLLLGSPAGSIRARPEHVRTGALQGILAKPAVGEHRGGVQGGTPLKKGRALWREAVSPVPSANSAVAHAPNGKTQETVGERLSTLATTDEAEISADGLRQYRLDLARVARQYKRYPAVARQRAWEGDVLVLVRLDSALTVPGVELVSSSGYQDLDAEAVALVGMAVRSANVPDSLRGRSIALRLPVRYSLREE